MKPRKALSMAAVAMMMLAGCSSSTASDDTAADDAVDYTAGVTVTENTDTNSDAHYVATFVYKDEDADRDAVSVTVGGNMQWFSYDDEVVSDFVNTGSAEGATVYRAEEYTSDLFNTGYNPASFACEQYDMDEVEDETFVVSIALPGNLYYYDYTVTYDDGTTETIQDPANPSVANDFNGHDSGHSLVYVGSADDCEEGQEYIYARDDQNGTTAFVTYTATDGTEQPLEVYLPYGYDEGTTYKTIYVSHGGGGNEAEWMNIGAVSNIMDNLIAEGEAEPMVVVTMDNTYWEWDYDTIAKNFEENIIPYIEENYSVSTSADDRAMCGLSMGSMTTTTLMQEYTDMFDTYGCFSGANVGAEIKDLDTLKEKGIYISAGNIDMALMGDTYGTDEDRTTNGLVTKLKEEDVDDYFEVLPGAHDWGFWRYTFTNFVKDHLWK
jgi:enterochelin esterase-like enzyme